MPTYLTPGIYVEEKKSGVQPIEGVSTSVAAFVGVTQKGPVNKATLVTSLAQFVKVFGGPIPVIAGTQEHYVYYAVRHFFLEGGTKCFVVRTVGYVDVNDASTIQAVAAFRDFNGLEIDGATAVAGALRVSALNEGRWGEGLEVQVENASRFSLLLAENIVAAPAANQFTLKDNADVQVGSVLFLVEQITGVVKSVDQAAGTIVFRPGLTAESAPFTFPIPDNTQVFSPDMKFMSTTDLTAPVSVTTATASAAIKLDTLSKVGGEPLKAGDILNFSRGTSQMVVVKKFVEKILPGGERAMLVEFEPAGLAAFDSTRTKVYARDFDILVKESGTLAEVHTHLSLTDTNRRDYVGERLGPRGGTSSLITAKEKAGTNAAVMLNTAFVGLGGANDGLAGSPAFGDDDLIGSELTGTGLFALDPVKDISILVVPNAPNAVAKMAIAYCERRKDLFFVMDLPSSLSDPAAYVADKASSYAAIYHPWIFDDDPLTGKPVLLPPSGAVAGSYAQTDISRGVHKAPAGIDNGYLNSATGIQKVITKAANDILYQQRINVIRKYPEGILIWGARTLSAEPAWKYVNVRRLFIFLEQSIERGLRWVVFEPNDYGLWKSIERNIAAFLRVQWEDGRLVGATDAQAFFVHCNATTNPPDTVAVGQVIAEIGVAPSKPAEFVVFRFKQFAGKVKS
jgi:Bacteriophage tail sheath protein